MNSWKDRLNELSLLPGETTLPLNDSWEKLEVRLDFKKQHKKTLLYWIAAACIIACFMIVWIEGNNKKEMAVQKIVQNNKNTAKKEIVQTGLPENKEGIIITSAIKKNKPTAPVTNNITSIQAQQVIKDTAFIAKLNIKDTCILADVINFPATIKQKPVVFNALKNKLPVVHINDLEKPITTTEAVAGNNERTSLRIRLFNRDVSPISSGSDNGSLFKLKLSPQN